MRLIDADALIAKLLHDVALNEKILDDTDFAESDRELFQFDKDCKQNAINWLQAAPTIEIRSNRSEFPSSWTPCSERLPDEFDRDYLVTIKRTGNFESYTENDIAYFDILGFHKADEVIAWMPAPDPYKGDF